MKEQGCHSPALFIFRLPISLIVMMRKATLVIGLFFAFFPVICAQLLRVEPAFPRDGDEVTIYYDATQGTGGLANCNCDVYLHTGVITAASQSPSDWKYVVTQWGVANSNWRMERVPGQPNLHRFTMRPSIRAFYGVPASEEIKQLAFVFRDASGNREGKDVGAADIFYEVFPADFPFSALLRAPTARNLVREIGDSIFISLVVSEPATIAVAEDGEERVSISGQSLDYYLPVSAPGTHTVEILADNGLQTQRFSFQYAVPLPPAPANPAYPLRPGIFILGDTLLRLSLYAPGKKHVFVLGDFNDWTPDVDYQMRINEEENIFWIEIGGLTPGENFTFQYLVDGEITVADPYSTLVLDPVHDPFIPAVTFPNLPAYPAGKAEGIVTLIQPGAPEYQWATRDFTRPEVEELVIYELLVRDFVNRHDYTTLIDTLSYLANLGVNAIELLPVNEFEGNISWGYNPSFHLALDKYYGPPNEFKRFVDSCHARGIAVILDVVYNHAFSQSPLAQLYWNAAQRRPSPENPWLNPVERHPFNVGYDFNHESPATREYVETALRFWLEEYRVDGFRFDLSKGFTQRQSFTVSEWNRYDESRIAILKNYADVVWNITPGAYVIMEHFAENREEKELSDYGMLLWAGFDPHNNYLEAAMGYNSNFAGASYRNRGWDDPHLIVYIESHDEERMVYKNVSFGASSGSYNVRNLATALERAELANVFFYTVPGPKMLWQFGELGYDFPINYCPNGTISQGCRTDPKPIRWDYLDDPRRAKLYEVTRALIYLKTNFEAFNTGDFTLDVGRPDWKTIHLRHSSMDVAVLGNFGVNPASVGNPFPAAGWWYEYFTGDSVLVANPAQPLSFAPGEYRLYTSKRVEKPAPLLTSGYEPPRRHFHLSIFPNPSNESATVHYQLERAEQVSLELYDMLGRRVAVLFQGRQAEGEHWLPARVEAPPGLYLLKLTVGRQVETLRMAVAR
jgi:hypothetical protein